jgi:hypothetical protein
MIRVFIWTGEFACPVCIEILEMKPKQTRQVAGSGSIGRNINEADIDAIQGENKARRQKSLVELPPDYFGARETPFSSAMMSDSIGM